MEEKDIIEEKNEVKPANSNNSFLGWLSFALSFISPIIGLCLGVYIFLSLTEKDTEETKVVSLMASGIAAFLLLTSILQNIL